MPRRRPLRPKRRRVFVGCEGESEQGYVAFLGQLSEEEGLSLHLDVRFCKGGDPLAIVDAAVSEMTRRIGRRGTYFKQAVFLDGDKRSESPERTIQADNLIDVNNLLSVWSQPTFEALLLRHLPGCENLRPATPDLALRELRKRWPWYVKGTTAKELRRHLDLSAVKRAASVEPDLCAFLRAIRLVP